MRISPTCLLLLTACLGPTEPEPVRYHFPVVDTDASEPRIPVEGRVLRLRRVVAASSIRERVGWRSPTGERGYFELERWAEQPVDVLERSLSRLLFEGHGFTRSEGASCPVLDVELTAFELVLGDGGPRARVCMVARLFGRSGGEALLERTLEEEVAVPSERPGPELSAALGRALVNLGEQLAEAVAHTLVAHPTGP